ncbi:hypothetical protein Ancab_006210, partial [Ancistrocladus abbreviatus]
MDTGSKFDFESNLLASTLLGSPFMMLRPQSESPFETQHQINMNQEEDEKEDKDDNEESETIIVTDKSGKKRTRVSSWLSKMDIAVSWEKVERLPMGYSCFILAIRLGKGCLTGESYLKIRPGNQEKS